MPGPTKFRLAPHPGPHGIGATLSENLVVARHLPFALGGDSGHVLRPLDPLAEQILAAQRPIAADHVATVHMTAGTVVLEQFAAPLHHHWIARPPGGKTPEQEHQSNSQEQNRCHPGAERSAWSRTGRARRLPLRRGSSETGGGGQRGELHGRLGLGNTTILNAIHPQPSPKPAMSQAQQKVTPDPVPALRPLRPDDLPQVAEVYRDAVTSQARALYSPAQVRAWAAHGAADHGPFRDPLLRGYGLVSCRGGADAAVEAFGLLDPPDRLALLYCRGRSARQGRASALLAALEGHARVQGYRRLRTEASQLSRPLLERKGWLMEAEETAFYADVAFLRWRMIRELF